MEQEEIEDAEIEICTDRISYYDMQNSKYKMVHFIPESEYITINKVTKLEMAQLIYTRIHHLAKSSATELTEDQMYIDTNEINTLDNSNTKNITTVVRGDKEKIKLTDSIDIAKREIALNVCPLLIVRTIKDIGDDKWVEVHNPNKMVKPLL